MTRRPVRSRLLAIAAAALAVLVLSGCLTADEGRAVTLLNQDRAANGGLRALAINDAAITKAQGWAQHLASRSNGVCSSATLSHSNLAQGAPAGWRYLGENVACRTVTGSVANAVAPLQAQLMASPGHRANILRPQFTHLGIGIAAVSTGTNRWVVFETQYFVQL